MPGYTNTASSTFTALCSDNITNLYDNAGYLVSRSMTNGVQSFKWDAAGRLVRVTLRDAQTNGYDWEAIYDAAGRRLRATHTAVSGGLADTNRTVTDSFYDPEVEFLELGVAINGERSWKILGPDSDGTYGGQGGVGGLEATVWEPGGRITPVIQDYFGDVPAVIDPQNGAVKWHSTRVDGYGPLLGYAAPIFASGLTLAEASPWRGKGICRLQQQRCGDSRIRAC